MTTLRRAGVGDAADLTRLRALMLSAMGRDVSVPGWAEACEAAFARRLADRDRFAAWVVEADGRPVSSGVGWLEEHLPAPGRGSLAPTEGDPRGAWGAFDGGSHFHLRVDHRKVTPR